MTPEGKVQAYLVKRIKALGGETRKLHFAAHHGAPDILCLLPFGYKPEERHPLVEVKRPGETPEPHQLREHERLRNAGFIVLVIDSKTGVDFYFPPP